MSLASMAQTLVEGRLGKGSPTTSPTIKAAVDADMVQSEASLRQKFALVAPEGPQGEPGSLTRREWLLKSHEKAAREVLPRKVFGRMAGASEAAARNEASGHLTDPDSVLIARYSRAPGFDELGPPPHEMRARADWIRGHSKAYIEISEKLGIDGSARRAPDKPLTADEEHAREQRVQASAKSWSQRTDEEIAARFGVKAPSGVDARHDFLASTIRTERGRAEMDLLNAPGRTLRSLDAGLTASDHDRLARMELVWERASGEPAERGAQRMTVAKAEIHTAEGRSSLVLEGRDVQGLPMKAVVRLPSSVSNRESKALALGAMRQKDVEVSGRQVSSEVSLKDGQKLRMGEFQADFAWVGGKRAGMTLEDRVAQDFRDALDRGRGKHVNAGRTLGVKEQAVELSSMGYSNNARSGRTIRLSADNEREIDRNMKMLMQMGKKIDKARR
jgi:hypothetical protein